MMPSTAGPIAKKVLRQVAKQQQQKAIDLAARRQGRDEMQRIIREAIPSTEASDQSPAFAAYVYVTNWALGLVETIQEMPELRRFMARIAKAEDEYMPSGPPMSPLTRTYFWHWALWDMTVGVKRETLGSILLAVTKAQGFDAIFTNVLAALVESRLGLFVHEGVVNGRVQLRDLGTDEQLPCICPAGHGGTRGELWLGRVLPPPSATGDEHVFVTTPYVILEPGLDGWRAYLARTLPKIGNGDARTPTVP